MTDLEYEEAKKRLRKAQYLRKRIKEAETAVRNFTHIESVSRDEERKLAAKSRVLGWIEILKERRQDYANF